MSETSLPPAHPLSRYRLLPSPMALPGKSACCGTATRPVIDTGIDLDFYGVVYFCVDCLTEIGRALGMVTAVEYAEARADSSQMFENHLTANKLKVITDEQYSALSLALGNLSYALFPAGLDDSVTLETSARQAERTLFDVIADSDGDVNNGSVEADSGESGTSEQSDDSAGDEGPAGVSSGNSHGSPFAL